MKMCFNGFAYYLKPEKRSSDWEECCNRVPRAWESRGDELKSIGENVRNADWLLVEVLVVYYTC